MLGMEAYREMVRSWLQPELSDRGFKKRASVFVRQADEVTCLVDYRTNRHDPPKATAVHFTVGIGVWSHRLQAFYGTQQRPVTWDDSHWRERLGFFLPENRDVWWPIDESTVDSVGDQQREYLTSILIPELDKRHADEALLAEWLAGRSPGLTKQQRLLNTLILVHTLRPDSDWRSLANELLIETKGRASQYLTEEYLAALWPEYRVELGMTS